MSKSRFSKAILEKARQITGKRSRVVVDHILKHGQITTEDLAGYGYAHAPRAIRDVREQGLPIVTSSVKDRTGKTIACYTFGKPEDIRNDRVGGRKVISKEFHKAVCAAGNDRCAVCSAKYESRYLQTDHRIPFEVVGESGGREVADYMPLCGSCNRAKSWSCEHCPNWHQKDPDVCATCYWAKPEEYEHVATRTIRRLDLLWEGAEVSQFDIISDAAKQANESLPDFVKQALRRIYPDEPPSTTKKTK